MQLDCVMVLHESLLVPVLTYGRETMIWSEKERIDLSSLHIIVSLPYVRTVQMDNLRGLLGIRKTDKVLNTWIMLLSRGKKGVDKKIDEGVLQWFGHVERMENDRIAKRVYVGEFAGIHSVGSSQERWIDTVKDCFGYQASKENGT